MVWENPTIPRDEKVVIVKTYGFLPIFFLYFKPFLKEKLHCFSPIVHHHENALGHTTPSFGIFTALSSPHQ
jgi:hypothetical protein